MELDASRDMGTTSVYEQIAIIGLAGRFPGAKNVNEFWKNIKDGIESIQSFTPDELQASGVNEETLLDPCFVNAGAVLPNADSFDASFFGIAAREAEIMDPQHRVFLEIAWEALENAGYDPENFWGSIGVFGGVAPNTYYQNNLVTQTKLLHTLGRYSVMLGSEREYAVTRIAFKLNLAGPSLSVNTACSTSGVAIHLACQSLLSGECDMALAGGGRINVPLTGGYLYEEGGIQSPDGHCRAFDAKARGTVVGSGMGMVVLKRFSDAVKDGDCVYASIKGTAINNDGSQKIGFTAPSVQGQSTVIAEALMMADVNPDSIGYVEAHGTGTSLGDPIEIAALTKAYRRWTQRKNYCPIGSVKTNIGHLDAGAGVAGVIKTTLALMEKLIPPSLNFENPNPQINFDNSPFYVNTELQKWKSNGIPRYAGVSSFGLGGTNAHIILEEAPVRKQSGSNHSHQLLLLSAKNPNALDQATKNLTDYLKQNPSTNFDDVAYTLKVGRRTFNHRRIVVGQGPEEAIAAMESLDPKRVLNSVQESTGRDSIFMFSGQGSQYVNMCLEIYQKEPVFKQTVDRCADFLKAKLPIDLRQVLFPSEMSLEEAETLLGQTSFTQPALFAVEYALTKLWMGWGIKPHSMIGHSIGEYVAACLAGVFSLEDALSLVSARGRLMQEMPGGSMLAIPMEEKFIQSYLNGKVSVSVIDSPSLTIVSGEYDAVVELEKRLSRDGIESQPLHTSHAFHSKMMEPALDSFIKEFDKVKLNPPEIPFVSNVTGTWIAPEEATDPAYWVKQLREPVHLRECFGNTRKESPDAILLEVGPGRTLSASARRNSDKSTLILSSTRHPKEDESDLKFILTTLGQLWLGGARMNWSDFYASEKRQRIGLPTYPFQRRRYWINPARVIMASSSTAHSTNELGSENLLIELSPDHQSDQKQNGMPRNEVESSLATIWQRLLGVSDLSIHDNFFDLGGSSLLATRLFTQVANEFGTKLQIATIFEAPTIKQLAKIISQKTSSTSSVPSFSHSSLVLIQPGQITDRPPFYCLPGNLGNVFIDFGYLKTHLGLDQPFYGLQDGLGHPSTVEALAAHYIEEIRDAQPQGPYFLGGVCSGGVVAFEMAQQLLLQNQQVASLALIEPASLPLPGARSFLDLAIEIWERFTHHIGQHSQNVSSLELNEKILYLRLRWKLISNLWGLKNYIPQIYPGSFHLFLTKESLEQSSRIGWQQFGTSEVEVHEIPGTHRGITGDYAKIEEVYMKILGEKLRWCIDIGIHSQ